MTSDHSIQSAAQGFSLRLKAARKHLQLTQDELASKSGLSTVTLSKLESGKNRPSFDVIVALSNSLNIDPNYFFGWLTDLSMKNNAERKLKVQELLILVDTLDEKWLDQIISLAKMASSKRKQD
ncbi:helix-turn-helix domain-containing protein [Brucella anthropi]|uniref:helix-turn-helix domain-containing protein n=1 Tax=Brucella anthropi TaxID=529 RepID=UPI000696A5E7